MQMNIGVIMKKKYRLKTMEKIYNEYKDVEGVQINFHKIGRFNIVFNTPILTCKDGTKRSDAISWAMTENFGKDIYLIDDYSCDVLCGEHGYNYYKEWIEFCYDDDVAIKEEDYLI